MSKISLLPEDVIAKIAAGEVIERPASVVKELLENSLDARAKGIRIEMRRGGMEAIAVYDDGEGIDPEDLRICTQRHATSKIRSIADLLSLFTFGFRGEALASIAQVSRLTIRSRVETCESGHELYVEFGRQIHFKPTALRKGTAVVVRDLFANLPARRAFLRSIGSETAKVAETVKAFMLAHPQVRFELYVDDDLHLSSPTGDSLTVFCHLFSIDERYLLANEHKKPPYHLKLILSSQEKVFPHTKYLYFFVNGRWVKDDRLSKLFLSALRSYYGSYGFPAGIVALSLPPQFVDFNVHPAKWEVRFRREGEVFSLFEEALAQTFRKRTFPKAEARSYPAEDLPLDLSQSSFRVSEEASKALEEGHANYSLTKSREVDFKLLGTFKNAYLLVEKGDELYIVDQHALAERVQYERLKTRVRRQASQRLLVKRILVFDEESRQRLLALKEDLTREGFSFEMLKGGEVLLSAIPDYLSMDDAEWVLREVLAEPNSHLNLTQELFKIISCKLARKKGEVFSEEEKRYLVEMMFKEDLFTCPHGRPIFYKVSLAEIDSKLKA